MILIISIYSYIPVLYIARHTWASIAQSERVPIATISEAMGHTSERTTRIYLASLDTSAVDEANRKVIRTVCGKCRTGELRS